MFREFIRRQLIEDIISSRFFINLVVILLTVVSFSLIFIKNYNNSLDVYNKSRINNENILASFSRAPSSNLENILLYCLMKPGADRFISEGNEDRMPQGFLFRARPYMIQNIRQEKEIMYTVISQRDLTNTTVSFSPDLTFIVLFLLSFFSIVLSFNAISAEKEKGTLRLIYSNSFKNASFIFAKYLAAILTIFLPLLLSLVLSLILLTALVPGSFDSSLVLSLLLFLIPSLLYLSAFILLGMLFSVISNSSRTSLVLGLLSWIFLVIIIPKSTGALLRLKWFDVPTEEEIHEMENKADKSTLDNISKQFPVDYVRGLDEDGKREMKLRLNYERDKAIQDIEDFYLRKKLSAVKTIRAINFVSPASLFDVSASSIAGTGLFHFENLWVQTKRYGEDFANFLKNNVSNLRKGVFFYPDSTAMTDKSLDANSVPRFEDKYQKLTERMKDALPYVSMLTLYNLFLFVLVLYKFQRYDVR
jgi:ABC-type transport system involved in multi-copper enzyme maturation permease subunit